MMQRVIIITCFFLGLFQAGASEGALTVEAIKKIPFTVSLDTTEGRMRAAADYQISVIPSEEQLRTNPKPRQSWLGNNIGGWRSGTFHLGVFKLWELTKEQKYMDQMMAIGNLRGFTPHPRMTAADDLCIGQMYLRLYELHQEARMLEPMKEAARLNAEKTAAREKVRDPSTLTHGGKEEADAWSFADSLFMAPPNWALLIKITGDPDGTYADYLEKIYQRNWDFLFDETHQLYYRDVHRIGKNPPEFWGRGNGWVMGSLALVLEKLPKEHRLWPVFAERLKLLSAGIANCELPEGGFGVSLMNIEKYPEVELSATALISFGMTFGINNGILPETNYKPIVDRAWKKVTAMQTADGAMRQCQQGGTTPARFDPNNNEYFGTGAYLLFASEYLKMDSKKATPADLAGQTAKKEPTGFIIKTSGAEENHDAALAVDADPNTYWSPQGTATPASPHKLILKYDNPILVYTVELTGGAQSQPFEVELLGLPGEVILQGTCEAGQPLVFEFDPVKARTLELRFKGETVQVSDIQVKQLPLPEPTLSNIPYGTHERQVLDFWKAESDEPTPLVFVIHGGGWVGGGKDRVHRFADVTPLLEAGISVAAINYRLISHATSEGVQPPVKAPLHDAARALQFVRSKAEEWNIDKQRIGAAGGSAGGCSSLWLAYHDDLADPDSDDLIARESTRLRCLAVMGAQTSLDPKQMREWIPHIKYGGHAFGFGTKNFEKFLADRENILPWIAEYSPYALVSADAPPTYLSYNRQPMLGKKWGDPIHSCNFGVMLQRRCRELGVPCELVYPDAPDVKHASPTDFLIATLKAPMLEEQN